MEIYHQGQECNGVYTIKPDHLPEFKVTHYNCACMLDISCLQVYCDQGWVVIQRRMDGSVDFYRNWKDYVEGFGDLQGEFWLGLNKINRLAASTNHLRVNMEDFDGNKKQTFHTKFRVGNENTQYQLYVYGYKGSGGDSLSYHNGMKFSTKDRDNDKTKGNCAVRYKGAWWYRGCHYSNLNGRYLIGKHKSYADGVNWKTFRGHHYSLKTTEMQIRRP